MNSSADSDVDSLKNKYSRIVNVEGIYSKPILK